jgi:transposase-like protein
VAPELAVAAGALGFWQAIEQVWPQTRGQRCWVHKTANVLNKLPKSQRRAEVSDHVVDCGRAEIHQSRDINRNQSGSHLEASEIAK